MHIPTPVQCLPTAKADSLHAALSAWLVVSAKGFGCMWERLGFAVELPQQCKWRTVVLIGDALRANDAAWKIEMKLLAKQRSLGGALSLAPLGIRLKCAVHQLALIRRPIVLCIDQYWTSLVQLGHLYEAYSFRRGISAAIMSLLQKEGKFQRTLALLSISISV